jgi:hypothetical protein
VLADAWPDARVDGQALVPARRLPGQHVALTALQWEIVANADRRRTPVELARSLGRDTFATLWEVRRLTRAGLVEPGRAAGTAALPVSRQVGPVRVHETPNGTAGSDRAAGCDRTAGSDRLADSDAGSPGHEGAGLDPPDADRADRAPPHHGAADRRSRHREPDGQGPAASHDDTPLADTPLPRRDANGTGWRSTALDSAESEVACSESNLVRIRDALEALR